jgi:hypothetical protein
VSPSGKAFDLSELLRGMNAGVSPLFWVPFFPECFPECQLAEHDGLALAVAIRKLHWDWILLIREGVQPMSAVVLQALASPEFLEAISRVWYDSQVKRG